LQLQGELKCSLDDELLAYISKNDTKELELLLNCRTNLESLPFELVKSSALLEERTRVISTN
jgi:hypothetical protein